MYDSNRSILNYLKSEEFFMTNAYQVYTGARQLLEGYAAAM